MPTQLRPLGRSAGSVHAGTVTLVLGGVPIGHAIAQKGEDRDRARHGVLVGLVGLVALVSLVIAIG